MPKTELRQSPIQLEKYIRYLESAKIIYECSRFDLKSKKSFKNENKYYLADLSLYSMRTYLIN